MTFHQSVHAQPAKLIIEPLHHLRSTGFDFKDSPFLSSSTAYMNIKVIRAREVTGGRTPSPAPYLNSHHQPSGDLPPIYIQFLPSSSSSHTARSLRRILRRRGYLLTLEDLFDKIRRKHHLASYIPSSWYSADVLRELTQANLSLHRRQSNISAETPGPNSFPIVA